MGYKANIRTENVGYLLMESRYCQLLVMTKYITFILWLSEPG